MPKYKLYADATHHEGVRYVRGDEIELDESTGERLQEQGLVGPVDSDLPDGPDPSMVITAGMAPLAAERSTTGPSQVRLAEGEDPRVRTRTSSAGQVATAAGAPAGPTQEIVSDVPNVETATGEEVPRPKAKTATASTAEATTAEADTGADTGTRSTRKR